MNYNDSNELKDHAKSSNESSSNKDFSPENSDEDYYPSDSLATSISSIETLQDSKLDQASAAQNIKAQMQVMSHNEILQETDSVWF